MVIDTTARIVIFTIVTTIIVMFATEVLCYLVYPQPIFAAVVVPAAFIACAVSVPICLIFGAQMRSRAELMTRLQVLVDRDRLTDVATRDFFFTRLNEPPNAYGVSLIVDIDHFKRVNDSFGHLAGDTVIAHVAQVLRSQIRAQDIVCRFGGEEFLIFLHEATKEEGWETAERIRTSIQNAAISDGAGLINVTVSLGGSLKRRIEEIEDAIKRADECLYQAKASGRNRTVVDWAMADGGVRPEATIAPFVPRRT